MCSRLNDCVFVIRKLGRRSVGIPFDVTGNQLSQVSVSRESVSMVSDSYMSRYKQAQRACLGKETLGVNGVDDSINLDSVRPLHSAVGLALALPSRP